MNKTGRLLSVLFLFGAASCLQAQDKTSGASHKGKKGQENLGYESSGASHKGKKGQENLGYESSGANHKGKKGQENLGYESSGANHKDKKDQGNSKAALASGTHLSSGITLTGSGQHKGDTVQRAGFVGTGNNNPPPPR